MTSNHSPAWLWLIACVGLSTAACQHTQAAKSNVSTDSEVPARNLEDEKVPMELWSPARRKASASFYYLTGEYEALNRNLPRARKFFDNAYNLDPNPFLAAKLIEVQASEDIEQALTLAKKMVLLYPKHAEIQLLYGRLLSANGAFEKAEDHLKQAVKYDPQNLDSYVFLIQLYQSQQKYKEAIPISKEMLRVNSEFSEGWAQLARLYLFTDQKKLALEPARKAYDLKSNDPEKVHLYAVTLEWNGEHKKAAQYYDAIMKLDPTNDDLIARMVGLYKQLGTMDQALKRLQATEREVGQDVPGISLQKAFIYWEQQEFSEASKLLDELAVRNSQSDRIVYMSGLGQERTKQFEAALKTYQSFDPSSEFYVHARYRAIEILKRQGQIDAALEMVREVIASQVDRSVDFYAVGANLLAGQKRYAEAVVLLDEGQKKYSDRVDLLFLKAVNLERNGDIEKCMSTLQELLKKDPEHAAAHNYLGYMYAERGIKLEEAEAHIKKALEIKPDDGYYLDSLGWVYFQQGLYQKALETLLRANELVANEGVILEHIADTYDALDQEEKAFEFYERASKAKLEDRDRKRVMDKYERAKKQRK
jgi:tetratricopeptide (TPR) repeat protein